MRGKDSRDFSGGKNSGITPACAGKSVLKPKKVKNHADHPRVCGEKYDTKLEEALEQGSPPRVRGKE